MSSLRARPIAVLHIGAEKTGSTSIQGFLTENKSALRARGVALSYAGAPPQQTGLVRYALDEDKLARMRRKVIPNMRSALDQSPEEIKQTLERGVSSLPSSTRVWLLSSELLSSRLDRSSELMRLRSLLEPYVSGFRIVFYLRRQVDAEVSHHSTRIRHDNWDASVIRPVSRNAHKFNYEHSIDLWSRAFGADAMRLRIYEPGALIGGDVISDFLDTAELGSSHGLGISKRLNTSINARSEAVMRRAAKHWPAASRPIVHRLNNRLAEHLRDVLPGPSRKPSRAEAEAFQRHFTKGNEAVRQRWFPDRASLFSDDFSKFPELCDGHGGREATDALIDDMGRVIAAFIVDADRKAMEKHARRGSGLISRSDRLLFAKLAGWIRSTQLWARLRRGFGRWDLRRIWRSAAD